MGITGSKPVVGVVTHGWHVLEDEEAPAQKETKPMKPAPKPEAPKPAAPKPVPPKPGPLNPVKRTKPVAPTLRQEFMFTMTNYHGTVFDRTPNAVGAWNFLRNNPLTRGKFRPIAHMLHPAAIGDNETKRLVFYADEIRWMLLFTKTSAPGPFDKKNTVHARGIDVLDNFHGFCALHVAANKAALETYRNHEEGLPYLDYGV